MIGIQLLQFFSLLFGVNYNMSTHISALLSVIIFIDLLVYVPLLSKGFIKGAIIDLVKIGVTFLILSIFHIKFNVLNIALLIYSISVVIIFYTLIISLKDPILKKNLLEYLRGYVDSWLLDDPRRLDKLLEESSVEYTTKINYLVFPNTNPKPLMLLIPYIHFGPFKNIGSSSFPYTSSSYFNLRKNISAVVFHTPSSHELDLASNEQAYKILNTAVNFQKPIICNKISDIVREKEGKATVYGIRLCNAVMLFLEYEEMEDVPHIVINKLEKYARTVGFSQLFIIDCHNSLVDKSLILSEKAVNELIIASMKVLDRLKNVDQSYFKIGYIKIKPENISPTEGLGSSGISILYYETINKSNCIVVFDSNNLSPKLREEVINTLKNEGIDNLIIATTDTHEVTALEIIKGGYRILGEDESTNKIIVNNIKTGFAYVKKQISNSDVHIYSNQTPVKILGYDLLDKLGIISLNAFKKFKIFIYFSVITIYLFNFVGLFFL